MRISGKFVSAAAAAVALGLALTGCTAEPAPATADAEPPPLVVPDIIGLTLDDTWDVLRDEGIDYDVWNYQFDLSVLHRDVDGPHDWTVATTVPAVGTEIAKDDPIYLFVLHDSEYEWFTDHPRLPRIEPKGEGWDLTDDDAIFGPVEDLVEFRYVPGLTPSYADRTRYWPKPDSGLRPDPSIEPRAERKVRAKYREADEYDLVVGTAQRPGSALRPGQVITVLVRPPRSTNPEVYPGYVEEDWDWDPDVHLGDGDDDDDFNVPGWLCPTRFC